MTRDFAILAFLSLLVTCETALVWAGKAPPSVFSAAIIGVLAWFAPSPFNRREKRLQIPALPKPPAEFNLAPPGVTEIPPPPKDAA